jgi:hypothetical protein
MFYSILSKIYPDGKMITVGTPGLGVRQPDGAQFRMAFLSLVFSTHFLEDFDPLP